MPSGRDERMEISDDNETEVLEVDNLVVVPTNQKILFLLTSSDVPRLWWVPELDIKQEAVPGVISDRWAEIRKPGIYRGKRGRECARAQQAVPIVIIAKAKRENRKWIGAKKHCYRRRCRARKAEIQLTRKFIAPFPRNKRLAGKQLTFRGF